KVADLLEKINVNLAQIFIVSKLDIVKEGFGKYKGVDVSIDVLEAPGHTCSRCWQVVPEVNEDGICPRCEEVVK
ncbi:MAG TPA: hypothetical protein PKU69_02145, partial [Bacillota bacterium]|nr:hypothetical protein [Bacillota bacterium]